MYSYNQSTKMHLDEAFPNSVSAKFSPLVLAAGAVGVTGVAGTVVLANKLQTLTEQSHCTNLVKGVQWCTAAPTRAVVKNMSDTTVGDLLDDKQDRCFLVDGKFDKAVIKRELETGMKVPEMMFGSFDYPDHYICLKAGAGTTYLDATLNPAVSSALLSDEIKKTKLSQTIS